MVNEQEGSSQVNNWFSTNIRYEGHGQAEFLDPAGIVEGFVKIEFDETGQATVEMEIESYETDQELQFGLMELLSSEKPVEENGQIKFSGLPGTNSCISLTVTTSDGTYTVSENIFYNPIIELSCSEGRIQFFLTLSRFEVANAGQPKYWVIPLFNFVSEFQQRNRLLDQHTLRIRPKHDVDNSTRAGFIHNFLFSEVDHLIVFRLKEKLGFIEPLADFNERKSKLISGQIQRTITAVMVGEVGSNPVAPSNFREELPFEFLVLLGLATGSEVGIAWIELRDENGNLVQRIHDRFSKPQFSKGHKTISEVSHRGTGNLLTQSQSSAFYRKAPLGPVVADLVQGGLERLGIEDKLSVLCRALDHLCKHYGLDTQNLLKALDSTQQNFVKGTLKDTAKTIRTAAQGINDASQSQIISRIAEKVSNAGNIDRNFGLAVVDLLTKFNLPDAQIIDAHYQANPRADKIPNWASVLSYYRGAAVHIGYFDLKSGEYDIHDLVRVTIHLHDIIIRIAFKMLGYNGMYQPPVIRFATREPVDWVTPATPASRLGY